MKGRRGQSLSFDSSFSEFDSSTIHTRSKSRIYSSAQARRPADANTYANVRNLPRVSEAPVRDDEQVEQSRLRMVADIIAAQAKAGKNNQQWLDRLYELRTGIHR